jgi:hypothetical protein
MRPALLPLREPTPPGPASHRVHPRDELRRLGRHVARAFDRAVVTSLNAGRVPGLRTAKTTGAAVLAFLIADSLTSSPAPVLAPLTALLVAQLTTYETLTSSLDRVVSVLAGVLVAVGLATIAGLTWWSLGLAVGFSLVLGMLLRLGPNLLEVPISAMIVLAVGGGADQAEGRFYETLIGAAVGVAVNLFVAPPLHVRPAADSLNGLAERMAAVLQGLAADVRSDWSRESADRWLDDARALAGPVARADQTLARAERSARFNLRGSVAREAQPRLQTGLAGMEHGYVALRSLCRALLDRTYYVPDAQQAYSPPAREALAEVLDRVADLMRLVGSHTSSSPTTSSTHDADAPPALREGLRRLSDERDRLSALLVVDPAHDEAAWQQHGALLAAVDRLRVEIEAAVGPTGAPPATTRASLRPSHALRRRAGSRSVR